MRRLSIPSFMAIVMMLFLLTDCNNTKQPENTTDPTAEGKANSPFGSSSRKQKKITVRGNPGRNSVDICVIARMPDGEFDWVDVELFMDKGAKITRIARTTFTSDTPKQLKLNFNEKVKFDLIVKAVFYQGNVPTESAWCDPSDPACQIVDRCSVTSGNVATVKTTTSSTSTVTVSVDEN